MRPIKPANLLILFGFVAGWFTHCQADDCGSGIDPASFPGTMVIEISNSEIGIGTVAPFKGGKGTILVTAGPLLDGVAMLTVQPEYFKIEQFRFPYIFNWKTKLKAKSVGLGFAELNPALDSGSLRLEIGLEAENPLGDVRFDANFTTGSATTVHISGEKYEPTGTPLKLSDGKAVLVASGQTSSDSYWLFRRDDYYTRVEICVYFINTVNNG